MNLIKAKLIYLKDKQLFEMQTGVMRFLGKPLDIAKKLKEEGYEMLHIVDEDIKRHSQTNFDVYDHLTYTINVEVECNDNDLLISKLLTIKARVVVNLPAQIDLKKYKEKKLLVGKIDSAFDGDTRSVNDLIVENADDAAITKFSKTNRILVYKKDFDKLAEKARKKVFGVIS